MKKEFKEEEKLSAFLDAYKVEVPEAALKEKQNRFGRFIQYIGSPAADPLENWTASTAGHGLTKVLPLACGLLLAIGQYAIFF